MKKKLRPMALFHLLQRGRPLRAKVLAEELGIDERTLYRDIADINKTFSDLFQIIRTEEGYTMDQKLKFPELAMTPDEVKALESAVGALPQATPSLALAKQAITRLKHQSRYESSTPARQYVSQTFPRDRTSIQQLARLEEALESKQVLRIDYFSLNSQKHQQFLFNPYALIFRKNAWYLIGYHNEKQKVILLRVYRIQGWKRQSETFVIPKDFSIEQYFEKHWEVFGGTPQNITLKFSNHAAHLIPEMIWHESQRIEKHGQNTILMHLEVAIQPELVQWILGWGSSCEVIAPDALIKRVNEKR